MGKRTPGKRSRSELVWRLTATFELLLVLLENGLPVTKVFLPLGGGALQQIGLCYGLAHVACELLDTLWPP